MLYWSSFTCVDQANIFIYKSISCLRTSRQSLMNSAWKQREQILITPLGAGQEVGRSCIVCKIKDRTIVFDVGIHMQYTDMQKYPDFSHICKQQSINKFVDIVIITHFHLDHCGGLPYLTEFHKYSGPIFATMPTKAMIPYMLEDYRKVSTDLRKDKQKDSSLFIYTASQGKAAADRITSIALQQTVTYKEVKITPYYAGHVLGAGMFLVEYEGLSVLYTGDYNSYADRHLGAAYAPRINPNIIITETTYATTIRDTKRDRQRKMLKIVSQTVQKGGKVLIPVFALGRAQELSVLLETYWNRTQNQVPVYFSAGLIEKANFYYKLFVEWENQKIKQDFLTNNLFNFKKVKPFDKSLMRADFPYVLFATPGMLHGGTSLQVFKQWCGDPRNTIIIPGYCVPGTFGNKLLNNMKVIEIDYRQYEVNMKVESISFSAHADAKGIINLIRQLNAENIVFVHGDKQKMKVFEEVVKQQLGKPVFRPANKQTIAVPCSVRHQINMKNTSTIPKEPGSCGYLIEKQSKFNKYFKLINEQQLLQQLNMMRDILQSDGIITCEHIQTQFNTSQQFDISNPVLVQQIKSMELNIQKSNVVNKQQQVNIEFQMMKDEKLENIKIENLNQQQQKQLHQDYLLKGDLKNILKFNQMNLSSK